MMRQFRASWALSIGLLGLGTALSSQGALAVYTFQSGYASADTDVHSSASTFTDTGLTISSADPDFDGHDTAAVRFTAKSTSNTQRNDYFSFSVTAGSDYVLNLSSLTFQFACSSGFGAKALHWAVSSSLDTFTTDIATGNTTANATWFTTTPSIDLGSGFQNLSSVTFRIYVWDEGAGGNKKFGYLDNVTLNGVSAVPEPANVALAIFGIGAVGVDILRRINSRRKA